MNANGRDLDFSKCSVCGEVISEEEWFDFSGMCSECSLEADAARFNEDTEKIKKRAAQRSEVS